MRSILQVLNRGSAAAVVDARHLIVRAMILNVHDRERFLFFFDKTFPQPHGTGYMSPHISPQLQASKKPIPVVAGGERKLPLVANIDLAEAISREVSTFEKACLLHLLKKYRELFRATRKTSHRALLVNCIHLSMTKDVTR